MPELEEDDESFFGESYDKETDSDYDDEDAEDLDKLEERSVEDQSDEREKTPKPPRSDDGRGNLLSG